MAFTSFDSVRFCLVGSKKKGESYLSGTHGGFKGGEAVVKGAENGDDVVSDGLAFLQCLSHHRCSFAH